MTRDQRIQAAATIAAGLSANPNFSDAKEDIIAEWAFNTLKEIENRIPKKKPQTPPARWPKGSFIQNPQPPHTNQAT